MVIQKYFHYVLIAFVLIVTTTIYYPGLSGSYYFDDYPNIVNNHRIQIDKLEFDQIWEASWSGVSGKLKRPISVFSFSLNTYFTGLNPRPMKITNLAIHLLCGLGIIFLCRIILRNILSDNNLQTVNLISLVIGAIWLTHPIQLTSVLYIVQRMTSLASLFSIWAIVTYCLAREKMIIEKAKWIKFTPVIFLGFLSLFSKEIGILIPLYLLCIELFVFRFRCYSEKDTTILKRLFIFGLSIPAILVFCYLIYFPDKFLNYSLREFNLIERLLTESRVVVEYLKSIVIPNITELGLIKDNIEISKSLLQPISTLLSIIILLLLAVIAFISAKRFPYLSFGITWFFLGHSLESTIIPLELRFEHRNYLPSFGIIFALIIGLYEFFRKHEKLKYFSILVLFWVLSVSTVTLLRSIQWENEFTLASYDVERYPDSVRTNLIMGSVYQNVYSKTKDDQTKLLIYNDGIKYFEKAGELNPNSIVPIIAKSSFTCIHSDIYPKNELQDIKYKVRHNLFGPEPLNAIISLSRYAIDGKCNIAKDDYLQIMYGALSNKSLKGKHKAQILVLLADYYGAIMQDIETAINLMKEAVKEQPKNLAFRIDLSKLLLVNNDYEGALAEIKNLHKLNKYGTYTNTINKTLEFINSHRYSTF